MIDLKKFIKENELDINNKNWSGLFKKLDSLDDKLSFLRVLKKLKVDFENLKELHLDGMSNDDAYEFAEKILELIKQNKIYALDDVIDRQLVTSNPFEEDLVSICLTLGLAVMFNELEGDAFFVAASDSDIIDQFQQDFFDGYLTEIKNMDDLNKIDY